MESGFVVGRRDGRRVIIPRERLGGAIEIREDGGASVRMADGSVLELTKLRYADSLKEALGQRRQRQPRK